MLAEPRYKQKWSEDPRNTRWANDTSKFGYQMLTKMGWSEGKGLGHKENGALSHIKVKSRKSNAGVGMKKSHDDDWISHQDDFNALLSQLNQGGTDSDKKISSLEQRVKMSKKKILYTKFVKSKDLSNASTHDLACIFGQRSKSAPSTPQLSDEEGTDSDVSTASCPTIKDSVTEHGVVTVNTGVSVADYFAKKMAALKKAQVPIPEEPAKEDTQDGKDGFINIKKKKKKRKLEERQSDFENEDTTLKKKSKKKKRETDVNSEPDEHIIENNDEILKKSKKNKKNKTPYSDEIESQEVEEIQHKKKKKRKFETQDTEKDDDLINKNKIRSEYVSENKKKKLENLENENVSNTEEMNKDNCKKKKKRKKDKYNDHEQLNSDVTVTSVSKKYDLLNGHDQASHNMDDTQLVHKNRTETISSEVVEVVTVEDSEPEVVEKLEKRPKKAKKSKKI